MMGAYHLPERAAKNFSALIGTDSQLASFVRKSQKIRKPYVKESLKIDDIATEKDVRNPTPSNFNALKS